MFGFIISYGKRGGRGKQKEVKRKTEKSNQVLGVAIEPAKLLGGSKHKSRISGGLMMFSFSFPLSFQAS